jgi:hypothetical protein
MGGIESVPGADLNGVSISAYAALTWARTALHALP